jgi:DNA uptake protein ComE-like DNA-binding protein
MQRVAAAAAAQAQAHATPPAAKAATAKTAAAHGQRPSTAPVPPATVAAAAPGVRTPLATLSNRPALAQGGKKLATPPSGSSAAVIARVSPKLAGGSSSATSPTLSSKNKENAAHAHVHPNIKAAAAATLKADGVVKSKAPSKAAAVVAAAPIPAPLATAAAVAPIAAAPSIAPSGGLLSNLVSGRDTLLRTLNGGSVKELMELQTIGKKRAQLIVAKRDEMGPYVTVSGSHCGTRAGSMALFCALRLDFLNQRLCLHRSVAAFVLCFLFFVCSWATCATSV